MVDVEELLGFDRGGEPGRVDLLEHVRLRELRHRRIRVGLRHRYALTRCARSPCRRMSFGELDRRSDEPSSGAPYDGGPMILASIPSPSRGVIEIGPFELHAYGLMLALGVLAAAAITEKRWTQWGRPRPRDRRDLHPGRHRGRHRRTRLPLVHRIRLGRRRHRGHGQDLGRRPVDLGCARGRRDRGDRDGPHQASRHADADGRHRARPRGRAGDRPRRATTSTRSSSAGPTDLPWGLEIDLDAPPGRVPARRHVPPDVPVRVALVPARRGHDHLSRAQSRPPPRSGVRAVRLDVHVRPQWFRSTPCRSRERALRRALQPPPLGRALHRVGVVWFVLARTPPADVAREPPGTSRGIATPEAEADAGAI